MSTTLRTLEAVYENGLLRPLEPIQDRKDQIYIVMILTPRVWQEQQRMAKPDLRGKYRSYLSRSSDFMAGKQAEKALER